MSGTEVFLPKVYIHLKHANNLRKADRFSDSDPYVSITFSHGTLKCKTKVIMDEHNPVWDEKKSFILSQDELELARCQNQILTMYLEVFDWDAIGRHDLLGTTQVQVDVDSAAMKSERGLDFVNVSLGEGNGTITFNVKIKNF